MADSDSIRSASLPELTLNRKTVAGIQDALQIGLASYGEIKRLSVAQEIRVARGKSVKKDLRVIHLTGAAYTGSRFADALRMLG